MNGRWRGIRIAAAAVGAQFGAWSLLYAFLGIVGWPYGFFYGSDIPLYFKYAGRMAEGLLPFRDFPVEYPPLAAALLAFPAGARTEAAYQSWFAAGMVVTCCLAAVLTALAAGRSRDEGRAPTAALLFGLGVLASGAIIANRFDVVVALVFAAFLWAMSARRWSAAAVVLGMGFALKLTPVLLLPLLLAVVPRERLVRAMAAFSVTAALPFLAVLAIAGARGIEGLGYLLTYHGQRPLEIESVFATPLWLLHQAGVSKIGVLTAYGSQVVDSPYVGAFTLASSLATVAGLLGVYVLVFRRRATLRDRPGLVPLAALAIVMTSIAMSKVLSPQYFTWTLPAFALVAARRRAYVAPFLALYAMTQVLFPAHYWEFIERTDWVIYLVAARNLLLVATAVVVLLEVWRLPGKAALHRVVDEGPDALDAHLDGVPRLHGADARRRPGQHHVARQQRHDPGDEADDLRYAEDHVRGAS